MCASSDKNNAGEDELEVSTMRNIRSTLSTLQKVAGKGGRGLLMALAVLLPCRTPSGGSSLREDWRQQALAAPTTQMVVQQAPAASNGLSKVTVVKGAVAVGAVGIAGSAALSQWRKRQEEQRRRTASLLGSMFKDADVALADADDDAGLESLMGAEAASEWNALKNQMGSLQAEAAKASSASASPPPPPRKGLGGLFSKAPAMAVPSIDELTAGETPSASLCATLARALRAPVDIAAEASKATEEADADLALAMEVLSSVSEANALSEANEMSAAEKAKCAEQVGRAMLLELVDEAIAAMEDKRRFSDSAVALCRFVRNAGLLANELGVADSIGEVLYEGSQPRRKLEKLYSACLELAAPELLATIGMGDAAEGTAGVGLDTVETLRPLLKMREAKAERLMQEVVKAQMMKMMGDQGDGGAAAGGEAMARSVEMLEQLLDSGAVTAEDLESLKGVLSQSMGMPVEEMLARKDELQEALPPEGRKLFDLIERLYKPQAEGAARPEAPADSPPAEEPLDDTGVKVTVRSGLSPAATTDAPPGSNVKVVVKKRVANAEAGSPPAAPAPAPAPVAAAASAPAPAPPAPAQPAAPTTEEKAVAVATEAAVASESSAETSDSKAAVVADVTEAALADAADVATDAAAAAVAEAADAADALGKAADAASAAAGEAAADLTQGAGDAVADAREAADTEIARAADAAQEKISEAEAPQTETMPLPSPSPPPPPPPSPPPPPPSSSTTDNTDADP